MLQDYLQQCIGFDHLFLCNVLIILIETGLMLVCMLTKKFEITGIRQNRVITKCFVG